MAPVVIAAAAPVPIEESSPRPRQTAFGARKLLIDMLRAVNLRIRYAWSEAGILSPSLDCS